MDSIHRDDLVHLDMMCVTTTTVETTSIVHTLRKSHDLLMKMAIDASVDLWAEEIGVDDLYDQVVLRRHPDIQTHHYKEFEQYVRRLRHQYLAYYQSLLDDCRRNSFRTPPVSTAPETVPVWRVSPCSKSKE